LGFAGVRAGGDGLSIDPHLPRQWRSMRFQVEWRRRHLALRIHHEAVTATLIATEPARITVQGQPVLLVPGEERWVPLR
jgi:alpha,alpha-trehalose phosphorylase